MNIKKIMQIIFFCYSTIMIWLLFLQRIPYVSFDNYWETFAENINFLPFRTIIEYVTINTNSSSAVLKHAFVNLAGNVIMFIPLGFLLPYTKKSCCCFKNLIIFAVLIIFIIELLQLFTLTGSFDIDDIILNTIGTSSGFLLQRVIFKNKH